jgi:hypothetical protein
MRKVRPIFFVWERTGMDGNGEDGTNGMNGYFRDEEFRGC